MLLCIPATFRTELLPTAIEKPRFCLAFWTLCSLYNVSETVVIKITISLTKKKMYRLCTFGFKTELFRSKY